DNGFVGCEYFCNMTERCPLDDKSKCPVNLLWARIEEMAHPKRDLAKLCAVAEAERIVAGRMDEC
ncbi:unnamed protein product, partial [marine sediment metagenome]